MRTPRSRKRYTLSDIVIYSFAVCAAVACTAGFVLSITQRYTAPEAGSAVDGAPQATSAASLATPLADRPLATAPVPEHGTRLPPAAPPRVAAPKPNPNQALIDAADERYAREVEAAKRNRASSSRSPSTTLYSSKTCEYLCDELRDVQSAQRQGTRNGQWLRDRTNDIYAQMRSHDCRACWN